MSDVEKAKLTSLVWSIVKEIGKRKTKKQVYDCKFAKLSQVPAQMDWV